MLYTNSLSVNHKHAETAGNREISHGVVTVLTRCKYQLNCCLKCTIK